MLMLIKLISDESNKMLVIETKINLRHRQSLFGPKCIRDAWQLMRGHHFTSPKRNGSEHRSVRNYCSSSVTGTSERDQNSMRCFPS